MKNNSPAPSLPAAIAQPLDLALLLAETAAKSIHRRHKEAQRARHTRRGLTLKPGRDTPLWNELAALVRAQLAKRGEKAKLARLLGVPRQRLHQFLGERSALPDAERTLLLLTWLDARLKGSDLE